MSRSAGAPIGNAMFRETKHTIIMTGEVASNNENTLLYNMMGAAEYSTLFNLDMSQITTEAEVETRLLEKVFDDLGYPPEAIVPKKRIEPLQVNNGSKKYRADAFCN